MKRNYVTALLPLIATLGCANSSERSSTPVDGPTKAVFSDLKAVLDRADEVEKDIPTLRADFNDQTVAVVSKAQAYLAANMDNYSYTASGVEARMIQENYIKELKIAGLNAEKSLIQAYLPLGHAALSGKKLLVARDVSENDEHKEVVNISDEIAKFKKYLDDHRAVSFPSQSKISSHFSSTSADVQADGVESFPKIESRVSGETSSEEVDGSEVVE